MSRNEKGITLVALVITIIVLIILATVAISFAFGNEGLIGRAEESTKYYLNDTKQTEQFVNDATKYTGDLIANFEASQKK